MGEEANRHAGQGAVLLDIGNDIGALVVTMPATLTGVEVEARPAGHLSDHHRHGDHPLEHQPHRDGHAPHVAVVDRPVAGGVVPSLVFPELPSGEYRLNRLPGGEPELSVLIEGGAVTHASWPSPA